MIGAKTEDQRKQKAERKGPTFTFRQRLPVGMTPEEAVRRCEQAIAALAEGRAR